MKEGFWGNYETGKWFQIDDHERWIRHGDHAIQLGVPESVLAEFAHFENRETLLPYVFCHAPVMRWRCHGEMATFEFFSDAWESPLELIRKWSTLYAGDYLFLHMVNFHGMEVRENLWKDMKVYQGHGIPD